MMEQKCFYGMFLLTVVFLVGCGQQAKQDVPVEPIVANTAPQELTQKQKIVTALGQALAQKKNKLMQEGMEDLNRGDIPQAVKTFGDLIKLDPKDTRSYFVLVETYMRLKRYPDAIEVINAILSLEPDNGVAYYLNGRAQFFLGNKQAAIEATQKSVEIFQKDRNEANFKQAVGFLRGLMQVGDEVMEEDLAITTEPGQYNRD